MIVRMLLFASSMYIKLIEKKLEHFNKSKRKIKRRKELQTFGHGNVENLGTQKEIRKLLPQQSKRNCE